MAVFLAGLAPYVGLGGHVVTALSTSSDEPDYLLIAHSCFTTATSTSPTTWPVRTTCRSTGASWEWICGRSVQASRAASARGSTRRSRSSSCCPGYAMAGRAGAVLTMNALAAAAMALAFWLCLATGATRAGGLRGMAGSGAERSARGLLGIAVSRGVGAFFATLAATLLGRVPGSVVRRFGAAVCLGAMVATKNRFAVLIPAFAPAFAGRLTRRGLVLGALGGAAGIALVVA